MRCFGVLVLGFGGFGGFFIGIGDEITFVSRLLPLKS